MIVVDHVWQEVQLSPSLSLIRPRERGSSSMQQLKKHAAACYSRAIVGVWCLVPLQRAQERAKHWDKYSWDGDLVASHLGLE